MTAAPPELAPPDVAPRTKGVREELLMLRYVENSGQARHHEVLRERTAATIGATVSGLLGLLVFGGGGAVPKGPIGPLIGAFVVVLGLFGIFASWLFENRARVHRARISVILTQLEATNIDGGVPKRLWLRSIWYAFHAMIVLLGVALLALCWTDARQLIQRLV